jgi:hypothetical protein
MPFCVKILWEETGHTTLKKTGCIHISLHVVPIVERTSGGMRPQQTKKCPKGRMKYKAAHDDGTWIVSLQGWKVWSFWLLHETPRLSSCS